MDNTENWLLVVAREVTLLRDWLGGVTSGLSLRNGDGRSVRGVPWIDHSGAVVNTAGQWWSYGLS